MKDKTNLKYILTPSFVYARETSISAVLYATDECTNQWFRISCQFQLRLIRFNIFCTKAVRTHVLANNQTGRSLWKTLKTLHLALRRWKRYVMFPKWESFEGYRYSGGLGTHKKYTRISKSYGRRKLAAKPLWWTRVSDRYRFLYATFVAFVPLRTVSFCVLFDVYLFALLLDANYYENMTSAFMLSGTNRRQFTKVNSSMWSDMHKPFICGYPGSTRKE